MTVNIIYDNRQSSDYERLIALFAQQGITDYKFWDAVLDRKTVVEAINASHKQIVMWAKETGLREVCIAEQDVIFPAEDGWQRFLDNKPHSFDIYAGGTYLVHEPDNWQPPLIKVNTYVGNHCIIVSEGYYSRFLGVSDKEHVDTAQSGLGDFFVCFPMPALQRPGFSSNAMQQVNYNSLLKPEWIYGTLPDFSR